jgi:hypothetical protein
MIQVLLKLIVFFSFFIIYNQVVDILESNSNQPKGYIAHKNINHNQININTKYVPHLQRYCSAQTKFHVQDLTILLYFKIAIPEEIISNQYIIFIIIMLLFNNNSKYIYKNKKVNLKSLLFYLAYI